MESKLVAVEAEALRQLTQQLLKLCETLCAAEEAHAGRSSIGGHATFVDRIVRGAQSSFRQERGQAWGVAEPHQSPPPPPQTPMQSPPHTPSDGAHRAWSAGSSGGRPWTAGGSRSGAIERPSPFDGWSFGDPWAEDPFAYFTAQFQHAGDASYRADVEDAANYGDGADDDDGYEGETSHRGGQGQSSWRPYRQVIHGGAGLSRAALSHRASELDGIEFVGLPEQRRLDRLM